MTRRLTQEEFIHRAREVHGKRYDYSRSEYVNFKTKVCIACAEHGLFYQTPEKHLRGQGCPACNGTPKKLLKDFIEDARKIHGDKYIYSESNYVNSHEKVKIICPKHGAFFQTPNNHLQGHECPQCANDARLAKLRQSWPERELKKLLEDKFSKYDVVHQYSTDNRYPFSCDFYIKSQDLFIEYNGFYMHGGHWYDENNPSDLKKAEEWLNASNPQSKVAFTTWAIRDVKKRETARKNRLNYVTLWNEKDIEKWFNAGCPIGQDWKREYSWL